MDANNVSAKSSSGPLSVTQRLTPTNNCYQSRMKDKKTITVVKPWQPVLALQGQSSCDDVMPLDTCTGRKTKAYGN